MRKKTILSVLLLTTLMMFTVDSVVALPPMFSLQYGVWLPNPTNGDVEISITEAHSGRYSTYLHVNYPTNPASTYGSDSTEIYVLPVLEGTDVPETLDDLNSFSFYYYWPSGVNSEIPPQVDLWLDTTGDGMDDEWLLGQIDLATTSDSWIEVPLADIEWIRATGGKIYGWGSVGLTAAKVDLGTASIQGFGVMIGSPATRDEARTSIGEYYIDDIEINGVVFDFEPLGAKGDTGATGPEGDRGPRGLTGLQGPTGLQGEQGIPGLTGEAGSDGLQGPMGDAGPQGIQGVAGETGPQGDTGDVGLQGVAGEIGPQGPKGEQGDTGALGPKGEQGDPAPEAVAYGGAALGGVSLLGLLYMFFRAKP